MGKSFVDPTDEGVHTSRGERKVVLMAGYRLDSIAGLARQIEFAPTDVRTAQLASAEDLLHDLDSNKAYPLDFVTFRITGFRSRSTVLEEQSLIPGIALQHDLGKLIEEVSDTLNVVAADVGEPVLTIEDLTEKFNVTSKTIQRWRRRGLPARRFVFAAGKRRVGFLVRSVERFVQLHSDEVSQATNFSQLTTDEIDAIIRRARRLATSCQCCMHEIARRIAKKMRRSHLTVLHTIRRHDTDHPALAIFALAAAPVPETDRARLIRGFKKGTPLTVLAKRACRPRSVVYRVILEERIDRLTHRKQKFIDDPLYHQNDAPEVISNLITAEELAAPRPRDERVPKDLPAYFQSLYRTPLLTRGRERALFLKFNYHKFQFVTARRELDANYARSRDVQNLERHLKLATHTKNDIVTANLRLVVSVARRHVRPGVDLMELVSDGNITIMRAAESFDFHKGNKFSTYATLALMKGFARAVPLMLAAKRKAGAGEEMLTSVADRNALSSTLAATHDELRGLLSKLEPSERAVLLANYGVDHASSSLRGIQPTPDDLDATHGLSRQRIRQIEQRAMEKLRTLISARDDA